MNILFAVLFGIIEGITEWLPISSTGHLILAEQFMKFSGVSENFWSLFEVIIQLGAILAVVIIYFKKIWPIKMVKSTNDLKNEENGENSENLKYERDASDASDRSNASDRINASKRTGLKIDKDVIKLWIKIIIACLPAVAIVVLGIDEKAEEYFYNPVSVAIALIVVGIVFIIIEKINKKNSKESRVQTMDELTWKDALIIGLFQIIAAIFPGTSRSGATIIGALLIGISRVVATEFTFYLAIPAMLGASLLKLIKFEGALTSNEIILLLVGTLVALLVSIAIIKFLIGYIKKHDFQVFGWYRIALGILVLILALTKVVTIV